MLSTILVLLIVAHSGPCQAGMAAEIDHLLGYIESAECTFDRNGTLYDSRQAAAHIRGKYSRTRRWIKSSEDFIRYAATGSSISGQPYLVICNGVTAPTAAWLADELARFRENAQ